MFVEEVMHRDVVTVSPAVALTEAYHLMQTGGFRHLPVMDGGRLVGVVTDRDLRLATSQLADRPFSPEARVGDVMSAPVSTAYPRDPVELAARTMRDARIGCLPVEEDETLVGIVTVTDLIDAFLAVTGARRPSGRLELQIQGRPEEFATLTRVFAELDISIASILTTQEPDGRTRVIVRPETIDLREVSRRLCSEGLEIVWPPPLACQP
ncbi:MAG: CBS and ACT domain-containing protein [Acidimicrobiia bacterium]